MSSPPKPSSSNRTDGTGVNGIVPDVEPDGGGVARSGREAMRNSKVKAITARTHEQQTLLYNLRYRHYVFERGIYLEVSDHDNMILREDMDCEATNIAAVKDGEVVGSIRINWMDEPAVRAGSGREPYRMDEFMADKVGRAAVVSHLISDCSVTLYALLASLVKDIEERGASYILIASSNKLLSFYISMGFRKYLMGVEMGEMGVEMGECGVRNVIYLDVEDLLSRNTWYRSFARSTAGNTGNSNKKGVNHEH